MLSSPLPSTRRRTPLQIVETPAGASPSGYRAASTRGAGGRSPRRRAVAAEIAHALGATLDVMVVRKLGVPGHEEFAMGAIASGGVQVLDEPLIHRLGLDERRLAHHRSQRHELERREREFKATELSVARRPAGDPGRRRHRHRRDHARGDSRGAPGRGTVSSPVAAPKAWRRCVPRSTASNAWPRRHFVRWASGTGTSTRPAMPRRARLRPARDA